MDLEDNLMSKVGTVVSQFTSALESFKSVTAEIEAKAEMLRRKEALSESDERLTIAIEFRRVNGMVVGQLKPEESDSPVIRSVGLNRYEAGRRLFSELEKGKSLG